MSAAGYKPDWTDAMRSGELDPDDGIVSAQHTPNDREPCPACGHAVSVTFGPDFRFSPPCSRPKMWTAQCGGDCFDLKLTWTAFTRERATEMWNKGVRAAIATIKQEPLS